MAALEQELQAGGRLEGEEVPTILRPHPAMVLEAFRYAEPKDIRVIIIGQDPYPQASHACGLSFSRPRPASIHPSSLGNIYKACERAGLEEPPAHGDLRGWARQGVLLLNTFLTKTAIFRVESGRAKVISNKNKKMHAFWGDYTRAVLEEVLAINPKCCVFLWGVPAAERFGGAEAKFAPGGSHFLRYAHPSPINGSSNFAECDHFERAKALVGPINWDPEAHPDRRVLAIACDGGCHGNGRADAKAVSAVVIPAEYHGENVLQPAKWRHRLKGELWAWEGGHCACSPPEESREKPSSPRAELLAMVKAVEAAVDWYRQRPGRMCPIHIIADNTYAINALQYSIFQGEAKRASAKNADLIATLREAALELASYLPATEEFEKTQNPQHRLIGKEFRIWNAILESDSPAAEQYFHWTGVTVYHVRSHQAEPPRGSGHWYRWRANRAADELACPK
jgi:uracil-DNA glycosylase